MGFSQAHSCFLPPPSTQHYQLPSPAEVQSRQLALPAPPLNVPFPLSSTALRQKTPSFPFVLLIHYKGVGSVLFETCDLLFWRHLCFKNKVLFSIILNVALRNNLLKCSIFVLKVVFYYLLWISEGRFNPLCMKISARFRKRLPFSLLIHSYNNIL